MEQFGFITNTLEIKLLILYIVSRLSGPAPFEVLQDLSMCDDGVDYFGFSECLADLVRTEHLLIDKDQLYSVTEKGRVNSAVCETSLPYSVRMQVEKDLVVYNEQIKRRNLVGARVEARQKGGYTVTLSLSDEFDDLMKLDLMVFCVTMSSIEREYTANVAKAVGAGVGLVLDKLKKA